MDYIHILRLLAHPVQFMVLFRQNVCEPSQPCSVADLSSSPAANLCHRCL